MYTINICCIGRKSNVDHNNDRRCEFSITIADKIFKYHVYKFDNGFSFIDPDDEININFEDKNLLFAKNPEMVIEDLSPILKECIETTLKNILGR